VRLVLTGTLKAIPQGLKPVLYQALNVGPEGPNPSAKRFFRKTRIAAVTTLRGWGPAVLDHYEEMHAGAYDASFWKP
jgi:hypothetical protein